MLRHWFFIAIALFRLLRAFAKALWDFRFGLNQLLALPEQARLSPVEIRRLRHYHLGTQFLSFLFCSILGRRKNGREQQLFFELSALAAFFDDLVDAQREMFETSNTPAPDNPVAFGQMADERNLSLHFYQNVLQGLPKENLPMFQEHLHRIYAVEMAGQQRKQDMDMNSISKITAEKGGSAVLLFRCLLQPLPSVQEQKALMAFGYLIQLSDDIFDLWFDRQEKTVTMATLLAESSRVGELAQCFEGQLTRTKQAFREIPVPAWRIHIALAGVHALTAITRTCLQRYATLEKKEGGLPFENRQKMVVDMEKYSNKMRALGFLFLSR